MASAVSTTRRLLWRLFLAAISLVTLSCVLGVLIWALVDGRLPDARQLLVEIALARVPGSTIRFEALSGSLLERFEIEGLEIDLDESGEPLEIARVRAAVDWAALRSESTLRIEDLEIAGLALVVEAERSPRTGWRLQGIGSSTDPAEGLQDDSWPVPVEIAALSLRESQLRVSGPDLSLAWRIEGQAAQLRLPPASGVAAAELPQIALEFALLEPGQIGSCRIAGSRGQISLANSRLSVGTDTRGLDDCGKFALEGALALSGTGDRPRLGSGEISVEFAGVDLAALQAGWRPSLLTGKLGLSIEELDEEGAAFRVVAELADSRLAEQRFERFRAAATLAGPWTDLRGPFESQARIPLAGAERPEVVAIETKGAVGAPGQLRLDAFTANLVGQPGLSVQLLEPAHLQWQGDRIAAREIALRAGGGGTIRGSAVLEGERLESARVDIAALDLEPLARRLVPDLQGKALLSAQLLASGTIAEPMLEGRVTIDEPRLQTLAADVLRLDLTTEQGRLMATGSLLAGQGHELDVNAELLLGRALADPRELLRDPTSQLHIEARNLDARWVTEVAAPYVELGKMSGSISALVDVRGGAPAPSISGSASLADGRYQPARGNWQLDPVRAALRFEGTRLRLEQLQIGEPGAELVGKGTVEWSEAGLQRIDLEAQLDRYPLRGVPLLDARLDGALALRGEATALEATGKLRLGDARLRLPQTLDPLLKEIRISGLSPANPSPSIREGRRTDMLSAASADLELEVPAGSWVRGRDVDAEVEGKLRVRKQGGGDALLQGGLQVIRGVYRFRGRALELESGGGFRFTGQSPPDPELALTAISRHRDATIRVALSGRASEPRIELSSTPPIDSTDMLSYLVFGRPATTLGQSQGTGIENAAAQLASGVLFDEFGMSIAETLGVDRIGVSFDDTGRASTEVEKRVSDQVWVRYGHTFSTGDSGGGESVEVEWRFLPQWSVQSDVTTNGTSGVDLKWNYDF